MNMENKDFEIKEKTLVRYLGKDSKVIIPEGITTLGMRCFYKLSFIEEIIIPESVTTIEKFAFYACDRLQSIYIPKNVKFIKRDAFSMCPTLVIYCESEDSLSTWEYDFNHSEVPIYYGINEDNFYEKDYIQYIIHQDEVMITRYIHSSFIDEIDIPSTIEIKGKTYPITMIGNFAFSIATTWFSLLFELDERIMQDGLLSLYKGKIRRITLPSSLKYIGEGAFASCLYLKKMVLPKNIEYVGRYAFYHDELEIFCEHNKEDLCWNTLWCSLDLYQDNKVYYKGEWEYIDQIPTPKR